MKKLLLFVLLLHLSMVPIDGGLVATDLAFSFAKSAKFAPGFFLMQVACNSLKRRVLMSVEVGSDGEERTIVQRLEYDAHVCPSAPRPMETVIDIDPAHFQTAPSSPFVGEGRNNSSLKVDGVDHGVRGYPGGGTGGGGGGPGGDGGGPGGEGPNGNSDSDSDSSGRNKGIAGGEFLNKYQRKALKKLAKISIFIAAQTGTSLLAISGDDPKSIVFLIVAIDVCAYLFIMFSFMVKENRPLKAAIMAAIGSLCASLGFLLTLCLIIPPEFIWALVVASILFVFSLAVLFFT